MKGVSVQTAEKNDLCLMKYYYYFDKVFFNIYTFLKWCATKHIFNFIHIINIDPYKRVSTEV